jgi:hypothetical protein
MAGYHQELVTRIKDKVERGHGANKTTFPIERGG